MTVNTNDDWRLCFEMGTNHLGSYSRLEKMLHQITKIKEQVSVTVQIKEESFMKNFRSMN